MKLQIAHHLLAHNLTFFLTISTEQFSGGDTSLKSGLAQCNRQYDAGGWIVFCRQLWPVYCGLQRHADSIIHFRIALSLLPCTHSSPMRTVALRLSHPFSSSPTMCSPIQLLFNCLMYFYVSIIFGLLTLIYIYIYNSGIFQLPGGSVGQ